MPMLRKTKPLNSLPDFVINIAECVVAVERDEGDPGAVGRIGLAGAEGNHLVGVPMENERGDGALQDGVIVTLVVGNERVVQRELGGVAVMVDRVISRFSPVLESGLAQLGQPVVEESKGRSK